MVLDRTFLLGLKRSGKHFCPACQHERKNKRATPLSVTIETDGVLYFCHHCNESGKEHFNNENYNKQRTTVRKQERAEPENLNRLKNRVGTRTIW